MLQSFFEQLTIKGRKKTALNINVCDLLNRPVFITNHLWIVFNMSSFNHEWRERVVECHHTHSLVGIQASPSEGASNTKGDPSHSEYSRMPQQASRSSFSLYHSMQPK